MKTKADLITEKEKYLSQPLDLIAGNPSRPESCIQRFHDTGLYLRRMTFDSGKGGEPAEIVQITDMHFNLCDETDAADPELALTKLHRLWNADGESVKSAAKAMDFARFFDRTVITGDTLDYLSHGAVSLMNSCVWDVDPNAVICPGGHDIVREMQTGIRDKTPLSVRRGLLRSVWRHEITYYSEIIRGKAMIIALDNGCSGYFRSQTDKLAADLARARDEGLVVLIFQHEPLSTGKPEDRSVAAIRRYDPPEVNFYDGNLIGSAARDMSGATGVIYRMITENADIIGGIFCGHEHSAFYTEIKGSYTKNGERFERMIPQAVLEGNVYDGQSGHVMLITVL